uniref:Ig-like domain-containing protein n=1 Tax=Amphilophus citrinellus TaxID=61819 RepID=A0A3Q0S3L3_AMPCI
AYRLMLCSVLLSALQAEMVEVTWGEKSVVLPFKTKDLPQNIKVEWRHHNMMVHIYQSGPNHSNLQDRSYRGRTEMIDNALKNKDLSLTLKDLRLTDTGVYTCTVYSGREESQAERPEVNATGVTPSALEKSLRIYISICGSTHGAFRCTL